MEKKVPIDAVELRANHELLENMRNIDPRMEFKKKDYLNGLTLVAQDFKISENLIGDYTETMWRRMQNMISRVKDDMSRTKNAAWVQELPWMTPTENTGDATADTGATFAAKEPADAVQRKCSSTVLGERILLSIVWPMFNPTPP